MTPTYPLPLLLGERMNADCKWERERYRHREERRLDCSSWLHIAGGLHYFIFIYIHWQIVPGRLSWLYSRWLHYEPLSLLTILTHVTILSLLQPGSQVETISLSLGFIFRTLSTPLEHFCPWFILVPGVNIKGIESTNVKERGCFVSHVGRFVKISSVILSQTPKPGFAGCLALHGTVVLSWLFSY